MGIVVWLAAGAMGAERLQLPCPTPGPPLAYQLERTRDPAAGPGTGRVVTRARVALELADGETLRWRRGLPEVVDVRADLRDRVTAQIAGRPLPEVLWQLDPGGAITGIANLRDVRRQLRDHLPPPVLADEAAMTAWLARDVGPLLSLACAGLSLGAPEVRAVGVPSPVGLQDLPATMTTAVTAHDAKTAHVRQELVVDAEAARAALVAAAAALGLAAEGLGALEIREVGRWSIDRATGWPVRVEVERVVRAPGESRSDRLVYVRE